MMTTDRIEKKLLLHAPLGRVWRAISDSAEFGTWFGVEFDAPFEPGAAVRARFTSPKYAHMTMDVIVERVEPERLFSYRWHPYAIDPDADYSDEPTTLVEFRLEQVPEGTLLTVTESGFDAIPAARRDEAFRMNEKGWAAQVENVRRHVGG